MPARGILDEQVLDKVPDVTVSFWIIKILATTVGETAVFLLWYRTSGRSRSTRS